MFSLSRRLLLALTSLTLLGLPWNPAARATGFQSQVPAGYSSRIDGPGQEEVYDSCADAAGNVYVVGRFTSTQASVDVIKSNSTSVASVDRTASTSVIGGPGGANYYLFVTKYDRDGNVLWTRSAGAASAYNGSFTAATGVAVDAGGNVFITGSIGGLTNFGPLTMDTNQEVTYKTSTGYSQAFQDGANIFVAQLSSNGLWQWVKPLAAIFYETDLTGSAVLPCASAPYPWFRNGSPVATDASNPTPRPQGKIDGHALSLGPDGSVYIKGVVDNYDNGNGFSIGTTANRIMWMRVAGTGLTKTNRVALAATSSSGSTYTVYNNTAFVAKLAAVPPVLGSPAGTPTTYSWAWVTPVVTGAPYNGANMVPVTSWDKDNASSVGDIAADDTSVYLTGTFKYSSMLSGGTSTSPRSSIDGYVARLNATDGSSVYMATYAGGLGGSPTTNFSSLSGALVIDDKSNAYITGHVRATGSTVGSSLFAVSGTTGAAFTKTGFTVPLSTQRPFVGKLDATGVWQWVESPDVSQSFLNGSATQVYGWATSLSRDSAGGLYLGGCIGNYIPSSGTITGGALLTFNNASVPPVNSPITNVASSYTVFGPVFGNPWAGSATTYTSAYLMKLTEADTATRYWRWLMQGTNSNAATPSLYLPVGYDTGAVAAGPGGTVYWALNELLPNVPSNYAGTGNVRGANSDTYDRPTQTGSFLVPILMDSPYQSPTFSVTTNVACGAVVSPPQGIYYDVNNGNRPLQPTIVYPLTGADASGAFYWDGFTGKLYSVSPAVVEIRWHITNDVTDLTHYISTRITADWGAATKEVTGAGTNGDEPKVDIQPTGIAYTFQRTLYQDNGTTVTGRTLTCTNRGTGSHSVLLYTNGANSTLGSAAVVVRVVQSFDYRDGAVYSNFPTPSVIGSEITPASLTHTDPSGKNAYIVNAANGPYDGYGADAAYNAAAQIGAIIPVNAGTLTLIASNLSGEGVAFPFHTYACTCAWPSDTHIEVTPGIVITSQLGSENYGQTRLDPARYTSLQVYNQPNQALPGYNPNEEHALIAPTHLTGIAANTTSWPAVFALRNDLNNVRVTTSDPWVLVRYKDASDNLKTKFLVYYVQAALDRRTVNSVNYPDYNFGTFYAVAGDSIAPPYPLSILGNSPNTFGSGIPYFKDYNNQVWARGTASNNDGRILRANYYYAMQPNFWYDPTGSRTQSTVTQIPWMDLGYAVHRNENVYNFPQQSTIIPGAPAPVGYTVYWPDDTTVPTIPAIAAKYNAALPTLHVGDTLTRPAADDQVGLFAVEDAAAVSIIFDGNDVGLFDNTQKAVTGLTPATDIVRLFDYTAERKVLIDAKVNGQSLVVNNGSAATTALPVQLVSGGRYQLTDLPYQLRVRVYFDPTPVIDPVTKKTVGTLLVTGFKDATVAGRPLLLPNILGSDDQATLKTFYVKDGVLASTNWGNAVDSLYAVSRDPNRTGIPGGYGIGLDLARDASGAPVVTNGATTLVRAGATGTKAISANLYSSINAPYIMLIENNTAATATQGVVSHLFKVSNVPVIGEIKVIQSNNPLEERITLRHSSDFAGNASGWEFQWYYQADPGMTVTTPGSTLTGSGGPKSPSDTTPSAPWLPLASGVGKNEVVIQGSGVQMLQDSYVICRYRRANTGSYTYWAGSPGNTVVYPNGTVPLAASYFAAFSPGWIKRVVDGLNPFDARVKDFGSAPTATYSSMIQQAGTRYQGPVALNNSPGNINNVGLIELYQTVLERGLALSVNNGANATNDSVNNELLLAATRVSDFYMLLGNEAYADAQDPTVGITSQDGTYKSLAPSLFAFQNMVPSLMDEELDLLRGRDNTGTTTGAAPVYNRLYWNFTSGLEGEPVYVNTYNVSDQNSDGFINAADSAIMFPQGHGDAWGHYLSAIKEHYRLLRHPNYTWKPRAETTLIQGVGVEVDYFDEKKFAAAAAARANAGAEIVNLTYRHAYVADPSGQWQGYADTDRARAWGVDDWARRAGQGAYLDWVTATAVLPANQTKLLPPNNAQNATGLSKIDRTTITDLGNIANAYTKVQGQMDQADQGMNPLGLTPGAIPFDIDPTFLQVGSTVQGNTHFEQIMQRATAATSSAKQIFDYANDLTNRLRQTQLSSDQFATQSRQQEQDYKNQLIAIFGYPYSGDIGSGGLYPTGYDGPDLYHYIYVPVNDVSGTVVTPDTSFIGSFASFGSEFTAQTSGGGSTTGSFSQVVSHFFPNDGVESAASAAAALKVPFPISTASDWSFIAPKTWGSRRAPGALQMGINDIVTAEAGLRRGAVDYRNQLAHIQDLIDLLHARAGIQATEINLLNSQNSQIKTLNDAIVKAQGVVLGLDVGAQAARDIAEATSEAIPTDETAFGGDLGSIPRGIILGIGYAAADVMASVSASQQSQINQSTADQSTIANETQLSLQKEEFAYEAQQQIKEIEQQLRELVGMRVDLFTLQQTLSQSIGVFQQNVAQGQQLLEIRQAYRRSVAGAVQLNRYQDMTFRIFRNDALQKYRASFDLAAKYTYLAATAYDYETCELRGNTTAGSRFLTDIVSERALGQFGDDGSPVVGASGLSDPLARLSQNFAVLKGQLGINNPQFESGRFSLRNELFRILPDDGETWRDKLQNLRVDNLWSVPEFRRYCKPFAPESAGPQPGLVIPFNTDITFGYNFFHQELAGGDSSYDSSRYVTKISSVGVWFSNYNGQGLSTTPRVYLVPVGTDVLRTPSGPDLTTRQFDVVDQAIPTPFPVGNSDLNNPEWIPQNDDLNGPLSAIRQFSRFRAYHDAGFDEDETVGDTRLIGRSVWNTRWLLIVPGGTFLNNATTGLDTFILGQPVPGTTTGARDGNGVSDIKLIFGTYSYSGD